MTASENLVTQKEKAITLSFTYLDDGVPRPAENLKFNKFLFKDLLTVVSGPSTINITADQHVFLIQFCTKGNPVVKNSAQRKVLAFKPAVYNIISLPKGEVITISNSAAFELTQIYLDADFFHHYIPQDYAFSTTLQGVEKLFPKNLYLSPKLKSILSEIADCDFNGHLKNLYLKAKIIELLSLQLAQYDEEKMVSANLKTVEVEKMIVVKELIENNLSHPHSISSLARAAGTNEQYLKQHFKLLFGNTVFGYILSCKMEKAKEMLLTGKYKITEVAEMVGYKHATHFTSAFKKFFGFLPQSLKTTKILISTCLLSLELKFMELLMII